MTESELLFINLLIKEFIKSTGLNLNLTEWKTASHLLGYDGIAELESGNKSYKFYVECKKNIQANSIATIIHYLKRLPENVMLFTNYVNPITAARLKGSSISFIDLAGNAYINKPPIFIDIQGRRPEKTEHETNIAMFKPAGLKIIFIFLCNPDLVNSPYRTIAKLAGVSLGMINRVVESMKQHGFLASKSKEDKLLIERKKLLEQWVIYYQNALRPKLIIKKYTRNELSQSKIIELQNQNALWGGDMAASMLTDYLKPVFNTIYVYDNPNTLIIENNLRDSKDGEIEILKAFWDKELLDKNAKLVPSVLVYADLLAQENLRSHEAAKMIYDNELKYLR